MFNSEKRLVFKKKSGPSESGGGKRNRSEDVAAMLKALGADSDKKR